MSVAECRSLMRVRDETGVKIGEAFMVRTHPQWLRARELAHSGEIGELRAIVAAFSYFNRDPGNIRNVREYGGGGLMDIGCYPIHISRFLFGEEPASISTVMDHDPEMGIDRLASAILEFPSGHCIFTCSTQLVPYQRVQILGTKGRVEVEIPFNAPADRPCRLSVDNGADVFGSEVHTEEFAICDQYTFRETHFPVLFEKIGQCPHLSRILS